MRLKSKLYKNSVLVNTHHPLTITYRIWLTSQCVYSAIDCVFKKGVKSLTDIINYIYYNQHVMRLFETKHISFYILCVLKTERVYRCIRHSHVSFDAEKSHKTTCLLQHFRL